MAEWSLFTNHANVLLAITRNPDIRLRELAAEVGISERAVKRIVADLERAGYIQRERHGRRNHYEIN
uniref:helix-turn-helix transcriptional regulator n=1 Tax=Tepidiforma sp. TaxID=2682230 RepID=UPI002ADD37AA